jgi:hypothetical protein
MCFEERQTKVHYGNLLPSRERECADRLARERFKKEPPAGA